VVPLEVTQAGADYVLIAREGLEAGVSREHAITSMDQFADELGGVGRIVHRSFGKQR
jgi:hypothetical protein